MTRDEYQVAYKKYYAITIRFLTSKGVTDPDDIAQAAWVRAWEKIQQYRGGDLVYNWVNTIGLNLYRSQLRKFKTFDHKNIVELTDIKSPKNWESSLNTQIDVQKVIDGADHREKLIFNMYKDGNDFEKIAKVLGIKECSARVAFLRARDKARERLSISQN